jgi:NADH-quinone oxidoreductase subunit A
MFLGSLYFFSYLEIILYIIFISCFVIIIVFLAKLISISNLEIEKLSAYECGFNIFSSPRENFNVLFIIIAILFLVFDLEIIFLLPFVYTLKYLTLWGFLNGIVFIFLLLLGYFYEIFTIGHFFSKL